MPTGYDAESEIYEDTHTHTRTKASRLTDPRRKPFASDRTGPMRTLGDLLASTAIHEGQKADAPSPCWRASTAKPVKWLPLTKATAGELYRQAEEYERQTRQPGRQDGAIGRNGLAVLRALIFGFLSYATGRLDPSYEAIAHRACISVRSVARGLTSLKAVGILNWVRRCTSSFEGGRCILRQLTNAYAILPASQWRGYRPTPRYSPPPRPEPGTWGDHPPLSDAVTAAITERREGGTGRGVLRELESDPGDLVALALARLGRALGISETPAIPDAPG